MMLESLLGSKTVEKILFFLFVNERCYGTQLQRVLKSPLTPIQKGLIRLERAEILMSHLEGKTRIYQWNPTYALLTELQILLRKAYTLLSPHEKKLYSFVNAKPRLSYRESKAKNEETRERLLSFWKQLSQVRALTFIAKSKASEDHSSNGQGKGEVVVAKEGELTLTFTEKGNWLGSNGQMLDFHNTFRWNLDLEAGMISLEHLRFGVNRPVFLFHLIPTGKTTLEALDPHLCAEDSYFGCASYDPQHIQLQWRIIGPRKNEEICYYYSIMI
ncbi:MAG: hypothetical protein K2P51_05215 [Rhabdochlamydiaceae bacterium]|nr:hypothetical protein [Rhabdochlamydiaceae bacterium]